MKEYIDKAAFLEHMKGTNRYFDVRFDIEEFPAADVVSKAAFDQVMWERDVAIQQLREDYGVGLGEKKSADVVERKRGEWEHLDNDWFDLWRCTACGDEWTFEYDPTRTDTKVNVCPNCGADMREV